MTGVVLCLTLSAAAQSSNSGRQSLELTLQKAIEIAASPAGDSAIQVARQTEQLAAASLVEARSSLLPTLDAYAAEQNQTVNPRALGLRFDNALFTVPDQVGPFSTFDARVRLKMNVLDFSARKHRDAAEKNIEGARSETERVKERVAAAVAKLYAAALRTDAQVEVSQINIEEAEALRDVAAHRAEVGEGTELDLARAKLQVERDRQKLMAAQTERTRAHLELIKALHLDWNTELILTSKLGTQPRQVATVADSVAAAVKSRADFRVQEMRIESATLTRSAAAMASRPSLMAYADYGVLAGVQTHTVGAALRFSIFDGGRVRSERDRAEAMLQQEQIREKELKATVELEVRQALVSLESAERQIEVAAQAIALAEEELGRARRRYEAGLTSSMEVIEAKTQLGVARHDHVAALYNRASARIELAQATGSVASVVF